MEKQLIPFKGIRKIIAERMRKSLNTAAQANHRINIDMTQALQWKEKLKREDFKVSVTDILVFAVCRSIMDHPIMNSTLSEEGIIISNEINIGIAVAVDNGLVVPCIKNVGSMTLNEISATVRQLVGKAQSKKLLPDDMFGGTFTVTNLGMYGISNFTAIINPPESAILAVGAIIKTPVVDKNDQMVDRPMLEVSLTYDHRVIDGAPAARFLQSLKCYLENSLLVLQ